MNPAVSLISQNTADTKNGSISFRFRYWLCFQPKVRKNIQNNALILHNIKKYQTFIPNPSPQIFKISNLSESLYITPLNHN